MFLGLYEYWQDIQGYENVYQISTFGRVKSLSREYIDSRGHNRTIKEKILGQKETKSGYLSVHLRTNKESWPTVHSLVVYTFIKNTQNKETVNHINCNKQDNKINNLEWATNKEQMIHALDNNLLKKHGKQEFSNELKQEAYQYYLDSGCSIAFLGKKYNISERHAGRIAKGDTGYTPKISGIQNKEIRNLRLSGWTLQELSEKYQISISQVHRETSGIRGIRCKKTNKV